MLYNVHIMQICTNWTKFELNSVQSLLGFHLPCPVGWSTVCVTRPLSSSSSSSLLPSPSSLLPPPSSLLPPPSSLLQPPSSLLPPPVQHQQLTYPQFLERSCSSPFTNWATQQLSAFQIQNQFQPRILWFVSFMTNKLLHYGFHIVYEKKEVLKIIFILISWTNILFWLVGQRELSTAAG